MRFFPKNFDFFRHFEAQAKELVGAAEILVALDDDNIKKQAQKIKDVEHKADDITHQIIKELNQTFITPIDREDITTMASHLDNIVDEIDRAINRLYIYKVHPLPPEINQYSLLIEKAITQVSKGISELRNRKNQEHLLKHSEIINLIENQADELHRSTLGHLFEKEKDPILIMKLHEIYDNLETVTDRCEDVANSLETIVVKNL